MLSLGETLTVEVRSAETELVWKQDQTVQSSQTPLLVLEDAQAHAARAQLKVNITVMITLGMYVTLASPAVFGWPVPITRFSFSDSLPNPVKHETPVRLYHL